MDPIPCKQMGCYHRHRLKAPYIHVHAALDRARSRLELRAARLLTQIDDDLGAPDRQADVCRQLGLIAFRMKGGGEHTTSTRRASSCHCVHPWNTW